MDIDESFNGVDLLSDPKAAKRPKGGMADKQFKAAKSLNNQLDMVVDSQQEQQHYEIADTDDIDMADVVSSDSKMQEH